MLILSAQTGAFAELGDHALQVPPCEINGTAQALHQALTMPGEERQDRARRPREIVSRGGFKNWFANQANDLIQYQESG